MPVARSKVPEAVLQDIGDRYANISVFCLVLVAFGLFGVVASGQIREDGVSEVYAWSVVGVALACFFASLAPIVLARLRIGASLRIGPSLRVPNLQIGARNGGRAL